MSTSGKRAPSAASETTLRSVSVSEATTFSESNVFLFSANDAERPAKARGCHWLHGFYDEKLEAAYNRFLYSKCGPIVTKFVYLLTGVCLSQGITPLFEGRWDKAGFVLGSCCAPAIFFIINRWWKSNMRLNQVSLLLALATNAYLATTINHILIYDAQVPNALNIGYYCLMGCMPWVLGTTCKDVLWFESLLVIPTCVLWTYRGGTKAWIVEAGSAGGLMVLIVLWLLSVYCSSQVQLHHRNEFILYYDFLKENNVLKKRLNAVELARTGKIQMDDETKDWLLHDYAGTNLHKRKGSRPTSASVSVSSHKSARVAVDRRALGVGLPGVISDSDGLAPSACPTPTPLAQTPVPRSSGSCLLFASPAQTLKLLTATEFAVTQAPSFDDVLTVVSRKNVVGSSGDLVMTDYLSYVQEWLVGKEEHELAYKFYVERDGYHLNMVEFSNILRKNLLTWTFLQVLKDLRLAQDVYGSSVSPSSPAGLGRLISYVLTIESLYHKENPFHNNKHAADVLRFCYELLSVKGSTTQAVASTLSPLEKLALVVSCVAHDTDHPGYSNPFMIKSNSEPAFMHNDQSTLENHHLLVAMVALRQPACDFTVDLSSSDAATFRELLIKLVLATDMSRHFFVLKEAHDVLNQNKGVLDLSGRFEHRQLLMQVLMKVVDVGHLTKALPVTIAWTILVNDEFFHQGDVEAAIGLPISPFMSRDGHNIPKSQVGFLDFVIKPLMELWKEMTGDDTLVKNIVRNSTYWRILLERGETDPLNPSDVVLPSA